MNGNILIFTDGASRGNPGPGGWGAIIVEGGNVLEIGDGTAKTTNNRMELSAAWKAIAETPKDSKVILYTDSSYLINGITKWVFGWLKSNWQTKTGGDVLNKDIWKELHKEAQQRNMTWKQIKGHAGIIGNNRADEIATAFADGTPADLFKGDRVNYKLDVREPSEEQMSISSDNDRKKAKAYSYLSLVDGVLKRDSVWSDCEARIKGQSGVKFRKTISKEDEDEILKEWGLK